MLSIETPLHPNAPKFGSHDDHSKWETVKQSNSEWTTRVFPFETIKLRKIEYPEEP